MIGKGSRSDGYGRENRGKFFPSKMIKDFNSYNNGVPSKILNNEKRKYLRKIDSSLIHVRIKTFSSFEESQETVILLNLYTQ